jgi:hypothetical protein
MITSTQLQKAEIIHYFEILNFSAHHQKTFHLGIVLATDFSEREIMLSARDSDLKLYLSNKISGACLNSKNINLK